MKTLRPSLALSGLLAALAACSPDSSNTGPNNLSLPALPAPANGTAPATGSASTQVPAPAPAPAAALASIGGIVTGLAGSGLVLTNNGGDDLSIAADGTFAFPKKLASGGAFSVAVKRNPTAPTQACRVSGGAGTVANGNVTSIVVSCTTDTFVLGGTVGGLVGYGLKLAVGTSAIAVNANGSFAFPDRIPAGTKYAVSVASQPTHPKQSCALSGYTGTMPSADVADVSVTCLTDQFVVGGHVTGLAGSGLVLQESGGHDLAIDASGAFQFSNRHDDGATFAVTVKSNPTNPPQTCIVVGGDGTIVGGDVSSVAVACGTDRFPVGGSVMGLTGSGLVLQNNAGDDLQIQSLGSFAFATPLIPGSKYALSVKSQPSHPSQTCVVGEGNGTMGTQPVTTPTVTCSTNSYPVGGTVSGLAAGETVVVQNAGGDTLTLSANGAFTFPTPAASGSTYAATVLANPPLPVSQTCTVSQGSGLVEDGPIGSIAISCATNHYAIGGRATGLLGQGLKLRLNGEDDLDLAADGRYHFAKAYESGMRYSVEIVQQPIAPSQSCTLGGATGAVAMGNVVSVVVNCTTNSFLVGGTVSGLDGTGLVLQNSGGDDLPINSNGTFAFATPLTDLSSYSVSVLSQPAGKSQHCTVTNGSGTLSGADSASVSIDCVTDTFALGGTLSSLPAGGTVVLQNSGGDNLTLTANGSFTFATPVASGSSYAVSVLSGPPGFNCTVTNGTGTFANSAVGDVAISCGISICAADFSFEDGTTGAFTVIDPTSLTMAATPAAAANGSSYGFEVTGNSSHFMGAHVSYELAQPTQVSWWERVDGSGNARGYFLPSDDYGRVVFWHYASGGSWVISNSGINGYGSYPVAADTWTHFVVTFDWVQKTITMTVDGNEFMTNTPFRDTSATGISTLDLYNLFGTSTTSYDDIQFSCPP